MAKTYNRMRIDVNTKPADIITEVQADSNSRYLDVFLYDGGVPIDLTGHEVRIYMRKPENSGEIWNNGEITEPTNGRCQFLLTTQALEKTGYLKTQISIWKNNEEILSTQIFDIKITENLRTEGSIESSNEYGALVVLFQNLYEAYDLMTEMVQNIGTPDGVAAQYDLSTMWQAWEFLVAYMKGDLTTLIRDALANAAVQGVLDKIGATADTGGSATAGTVMGKENAVLSLLTSGGAKMVKSIQHVTYTIRGSAGSTGEVAISTVTPERCIVLMERLKDATNSGCAYIEPSLSSDKLALTHSSYSSSPNVMIGFWIVEFY